MRKPHFKNRAARGAFTLIEILVVLVIMGFLVSLVAPKLGGIVDSAVDTNCDTNQERLRKVLNTYVNQNNALPSGMMNLVVGDTAIGTATGTGALPSVNDGDKANGAETLSDEFTDRFKPQVHYLTADEKSELIGMGVKGFKYLGKTDNATITLTTDGFLDPTVSTNEIVEEGVTGNMESTNPIPVMMAGFGLNSAGDTITWSEGNTMTTSGSDITEDSSTQVGLNAGTATNANADGTFARMDEGKAIGRILMGINNSGELVQSGLLDAAGICPGQLQNEDQFSWGNYVVVLPRLQATMDVLNSGTITNAIADGDATLHAVALDEEGSMIQGRTPNSGYSYFGAQEVKDQTTSCPEGHTWGANADAYAVVVN